MTRKNFVGGMLALGMVSAATVSPSTAQVPGIPGPPSIGITIGVKATTLGLGLEIGKSIAPRLGARLGLNYAKAGTDLTFSSIKYSVDLKLTSVPVLLDLYLLGPFRLSGGLVVNNNKLDISYDPPATTAGSVQIGTVTYQPVDIGVITGTISYARKAAPYLGLGIGGRGKIGLIMELGAMFTGDLKVTYTGTTTLTGAAATTFQTQVTNEAAQVTTAANDKSFLKVWPVIGFGLQIKI